MWDVPANVSGYSSIIRRTFQAVQSQMLAEGIMKAINLLSTLFNEENPNIQLEIFFIRALVV